VSNTFPVPSELVVSGKLPPLHFSPIFTTASVTAALTAGALLMRRFPSTTAPRSSSWTR
jgi:hypothetical protein